MIFQKIAKIKNELLEKEIKKSGKNKFAGFNYFELDDILPHIIYLNNKYNVDDTIQINNELAKLILTDTEDGTDKEITVPYVQAEMQPKTDVIQKLGASITYLRRYLYMTAYNITEKDIIDAMDNTGKEDKPQTQYDKILELINDTDIRYSQVTAWIKQEFHEPIKINDLSKEQYDKLFSALKEKIK